MALVHRATVDPSKQELVEAWLPTRPWAQGLEITKKLGEYRFDDPAGEVGVETIVFATGEGTSVQVPLTYRAAPLEGADDYLVGTSEHSVLGARWVYDGCADPVWAATLAGAILTGGSQAQMYLEEDGGRITRTFDELATRSDQLGHWLAMPQDAHRLASFDKVEHLGGMGAEFAER